MNLEWRVSARRYDCLHLLVLKSEVNSSVLQETDSNHRILFTVYSITLYGIDI